MYDPVTESHLPNALKILADNDRKWSGYYSYAVHFDVEDPRGWDWDEFDGPMRNIHVAEESVHLGGIEFPEDDPRYRLQIRREGVDAIDSFVLSGSISRSGFAMLTKRYLTQGHGWSYRGHVVAVGTTVGIAGFWFPLGFEAVIEGGEWEGNCGPFCLWVE